MVYDIIRDSLFGQTVRYLSGYKVFLYPEEREDFDRLRDYLPDAAGAAANAAAGTSDATLNAKSWERNESQDETVNASSESSETEGNEGNVGNEGNDPEKEARAAPGSRPTTASEQTAASSGGNEDSVPGDDSTVCADDSGVRSTDTDEEEQNVGMEKTPADQSVGAGNGGEDILVDWYSEEDPENPMNWSNGKKFIIAFLMFYYTFAVYCASAIYTASLDGVESRFNISATTAELGLAIYVLGYGIGPLIWAPMSEIPAFGRNTPYLATFFAYFVLSFPAAVVGNFPGLVVLRFLQGFFGSPCLANGGATMHDLYPPITLPYYMSFWVCAQYAGPSLGPLMSGFAVMKKDWRWSLWEIVWMSAPCVILWIFFSPETSADTILLRRARRLRARTGNPRIKSRSEIANANTSLRSLAAEALIKPFEITLKDPAVAFVNVYSAISYGIYYSFFEAFPLVYPGMYGMNLGLTGVLFMCLVPACAIGIGMYMAYLYFVYIPELKRGDRPPPERRLIPGLFAPLGQTCGLFLFAWTARPQIPWIVSVIGVVMNSSSAFLNMQCVFMYLPQSYPRYAASLFGMNDFVRAAFAFGTVMFSRKMYGNLGVARGTSLLGGLSLIGVIGMWLLFIYGARLRARSKFAIS